MAKSGIYIKPSKRGTFTAAANKRGKSVQGFASAVLANKGNYSPAMVKKANFARNAAKWKKQLGGYLDQELNTPIIEETPIDQSIVAPTIFRRGGTLDDLKYLDDPMPSGIFGQVANILGSSIGAMGLGGGDAADQTPFDITQTQAGQGIQALGQQQLGNTVPQIQPLPPRKQFGGQITPDIPGVTNEEVAAIVKGLGIEDMSEKKLQRNIDRLNSNAVVGLGGRGVSDSIYQKNLKIDNKQRSVLQYYLDKQPQVDAISGPDIPASAFAYGGDLIGFPQYGFGSWLGDNAGGILKGAGAVASLIPAVGLIAGPALMGAGAATDAIVGHVRGNRAEDALGIKEQQDAELAAQQSKLGTQPTYAATFQDGGSLMGQFGGNQNPVINEYNGGSNTHQQGVGGVPVDAMGNPSAVSRQSAVGLTEKGEVTWNGYVFSDKLKV